MRKNKRGIKTTLASKIYRHISVRLILISFLAIVPINIVAVTVTQLIVNIYQDKLIDSYDNQLDQYAQDLDTNIQYWDNAVSKFLNAKNIAMLSLEGDESNAVELYRIYTEIKGIQMLLDLNTLCYVKDNVNANVSISYDTTRYTYEEMHYIQNMIESGNIPQKKNNSYIFLEAKSRLFVLRNYEFPKYSFGILIDVESIMKNVYESRARDSEIMYLANKEGVLLASISEKDKEVVITDSGMNGLIVSDFLNDKKKVIISGTSGKLNYSIVRVLQKNDMTESIPILISNLRALAFWGLLSLPLLWLFATKLIIRPLQELEEAMHEIKEGNLEYRLYKHTGTNQMDYIYEAFNHMAAEIKELTIDSYEKDIEKLQTDSINMQLQVNPHMLLNSLHTIYSMAQTKTYDNISDFTMYLMKYFRYVLRQKEALVPLKEEMEFVWYYLQIQKIRFPDSFTCAYTVEEGAENIRLPQLLIQNFIENSVKYALILGSTIEILLNIRLENGRLLISICDTGYGMEQEIVQKLQNGEIITDKTGSHIGIWNCRRRLKLYYGDNAILKINSTIGEGTQIWIEVPVNPINPDLSTNEIYKFRKKEGESDESADSR